jgi:hypothetical protein
MKNCYIDLESYKQLAADKASNDKDYLVLAAKYNKAIELLEDLNEILPTALHNGHHDLIERVKEILK